MENYTKPKIIAGHSNPALARAIVDRMQSTTHKDLDFIKATVKHFNDEEIFVEVQDNVRGEDIFIIQSTSRPANHNIMELLIMADALRRSSANSITAVIPYFGYARQDRRTKGRTPISARLIANLLTGSGVDRVLAMDLHAGQIQGFFDIPVDNLYAAPVFALDIDHHFQNNRKDIVIVSPDVGGVSRARELAQRIQSDLAIVDKRRVNPGEVAEMTIIGNVANKICIIVDDICDTAGTLCMAANTLAQEGAREVHAYITHAVLSGQAAEKVAQSALKTLVVTDSIQATKQTLDTPNIRMIPTAPLFAQAIENIGNKTSISSLFNADILAELYTGVYPQNR